MAPPWSATWELWQQGLLARGELSGRLLRSHWERNRVDRDVAAMKEAEVWETIWRNLYDARETYVVDALTQEEAEVDPETWASLRYARIKHDPRCSPEAPALLVLPWDDQTYVAALVTRDRSDPRLINWGAYRLNHGPDHRLHRCLYPPRHVVVFYRMTVTDRLMQDFRGEAPPYCYQVEDRLAPDTLPRLIALEDSKGDFFPDGMVPMLRGVWSGLFTNERIPYPTVYDHLLG